MTKKYVLFLFLVGILYGIIRYQLIIQATGGVFLFPSEDSYIVLRYTEKIIKGHPFRINPEDGISLMDPSPLIEFIYSTGYFIGFKTPELLSSYVYWINILFLLFTIIFLFFIAKELGLKEQYALIFALLNLLFTPFRYNFTLIMGYSLMTFSFYFFVCLWLKKTYLFVIPALIFSLSRPEAPIILLIFSVFNLIILKDKKRTILFIISALFGFLPHMFYLIFIGSPTPSGFSHQFIFREEGARALYRISRYIVDYFKGIFLGFYPSTMRTLSFGEYFVSQFPPLYFIFIFLGLYHIFNKYDKIKQKILLLLIAIFLVELGISSLTIFLGVHLWRHTAWLFPIFVFIGIKGILFTRKLTTTFNSIHNFVIGIYFTYFVVITVDFLFNVTTISISSTLPYYEASKWIKKNIKEEEQNFLSILDSRLDFFLDKAFHYPLSPGDNWRFIKSGLNYRNLGYTIELFNYELKNKKKWFFLWSKEDENILGYLNVLNQCVEKVIYKKAYLFDNYIRIGELNLLPFKNAEKPHVFKNQYVILDVINPGDPLSEMSHNFYYYLRFPYGTIKPQISLIELNTNKDKKDIVDGGYICEYESFYFDLKEVVKDSIFLVGRFSSQILCYINYGSFAYAKWLKHQNQRFEVVLNDSTIYNAGIYIHGQSIEFPIYLPRHLLKKGKNKIEIKGTHIILRWFIIKKTPSLQRG